VSSRAAERAGERAASRRILVVTASARRRGAEIQACQLVEQLRACGRAVEIVALSAGTGSTPLPLQTLGRRRFGPATLWRLRRRARQVDVVVGYGSSTLPACVIALAGARTPFLYRSISDPGHWLRGPVHRVVTRLQYRRPTVIVALWDGAARSIAELFGVPAERITVIPNARDPARFRPPTDGERSAARQRFELGPTDVAVGFIGSLSQEKRIDRAIEALRGLDRHHLLVAGTGPLRPDAEALAERLAPGRVRFLGELTDVVPLLHALDAVLITSDVEGMPGVAIEAVMAGVPVVATNVGALATMPGVQLADSDPALATALESVRPVDAAAASTLGWPAVTAAWERLLDEVG
jgi:glycosyltransferase involved in cell wall biosynthesis